MKEIVLFGGSFDPPGVHHQKICFNLCQMFPEARIIVVPCGPRQDKSKQKMNLQHRIDLVNIAFSSLNLTNLEIDFYDLENNCFTPTHVLDEKYSKEGKVWNFVGTDIISGGAKRCSLIHRTWLRQENDFNELNFIVGGRQGATWSKDDLPPQSKFISLDVPGSSTEIRRLFKLKDRSIHRYVSSEVYDFITANALYNFS